MGILRSIFRIGKHADVGAPVGEAGGGYAPIIIYPPEDKLTFGFEEVFVTLALLAVSYIILSTPCFTTTRPTRSGARLDDGGWRDAAKRIRHVRNTEDLMRWWRRLLLRRDDDGDRGYIDPQRHLRRGNWSDSSYDADRTIRTHGGKSAPTTPLRSVFKPVNNNTRTIMHLSASESQLRKSPTNVQRSSIAEQKRITSGGGEGGDSLFEEDFRPRTDHDRFVEAWQSHIRFAEYRRLVLPPECKLVEFSTSQWREIEQTLLENFLIESSWNKVVSRVRDVLDVLSRICHYVESLLSGETVHKFSAWMVGLYRYRMRNRRGMSIEEEYESDDDDDGSVATLPSGVVNRQTTNFKSHEATPVVGNRMATNESVRINGNVPPLESSPRLVSDEHHKTVDDNNHSMQNEQENENDSSLMIIPQAISSKGNEILQTDEACTRPRLNTADSNDDTTFASSRCLEHSEGLGGITAVASASSDIPSFVEKSPKKTLTVSPLPTKPNRKQQRIRPDIAPLSIPLLKPTIEAYHSLEKVPLEPTNSVDSSNLNFFDTANSDRQLRDMSRAVPIPDARGYILGDEFIGSSCTPLLVFVNSRSGSRNGNLLITQFRRLLNPIQVWDLANGGPEKILKSFSVLSRFQLLICGGDGTVSWIISALEKLELKRWPPIGILPLGTGNDLSRIHGWGGGYDNESLLLIFRQISEAYISLLDLWGVNITSTSKKGKQRKEVKSFINYLGVGVDAQAALQVHNLRESSPKLFFSRFFNKAWYAIAGGEEAIKSSCANLPRQITLVADGIEISLPPDSQGIIFLNIDSYAGGVSMWSKSLEPQLRMARSFSEGGSLYANGSGLRRNDSYEEIVELEIPRELASCDSPSSCQDGLLDVVSIRGTFHLGQIRVGLSNAQLLCQCREATVTLKKKIAVQIDGEPWRQTPSTLKIIRKPDRATMLNKSAKDSGGVENEITKLLNWANEKEVIDRKQYAVLMEEFSRRIEYKRRVRKHRGSSFSFSR